jgi:superfamily II RNA helicase
MEDLFQLDSDDENQGQEQTKQSDQTETKNNDKQKNLYQMIKYNDLEEKTLKELETNNLDDSFEIKKNMDINLDMDETKQEKKNKIKYAVDDEIEVDEYDNIKDPAMSFPFELDTFQKRSIIRLEKHEVNFFFYKFNYYLIFLECFGLCTYIFWKNSNSRICYCSRKKFRKKSNLYFSY